MTKEACFELVKQIAPKHGLDIWVVLGVCEQESSYDETEARIEQAFYRKYIRPKVYATTVEILFSASYGLMQCLGWTLEELGLFAPVNNQSVPKKLDEFMVNPAMQIDYGCLWLTKKLSLVGGDMAKGIARYNGTGPQAEAYAKSVLARAERLKGELT